MLTSSTCLGVFQSSRQLARGVSDGEFTVEQLVVRSEQLRSLVTANSEQELALADSTAQDILETCPHLLLK